MHPDPYTLADTLEARADANDPLAPAEMRAMALAMRQIGDDLKRADEHLTGQMRDYYAALGQGHVVVSSRLDAGLIVINGGKSVAWDFSRENVAP